MKSSPCFDIVGTLLLLAHLLADCGSGARPIVLALPKGGGSRMHHAWMFLPCETWFLVKRVSSIFAGC